MNLSKNFTLEEMVKSSAAMRYKINNAPSEEYLANLKKLCNDVLQPIRDEYGKPIRVTSAFRCDKVNTLIGGVKNSDHRFGCAADITSTSDTVKDNKELFDLIVKMAKEGKIKCRQILDEYGYNWVHVSINNKYNGQKDNQILHIK